MSNVIRGESQRTMVFCIDAYHSGIPIGRIFNGYIETGQNFSCLLEMLKITEHTLEETNYPQAFSQMRSFHPRCDNFSRKINDDKQKTGSLATFQIRFLFRQNASWQGSVTWLEEGCEESFRSALELIFLINSALEKPSLKTAN